MNSQPPTQNNVIEVTVENFQSEVAEKSQQIPVLLEFYADAAEPSQQLAPVLRRLADDYQGKFLLARIDVQNNQQLVQQLGVRTLPTLKIVFQGQMVENLEGPQEEANLRAILDNLTLSPMDRIREQMEIFLAEGNRPQAIEMLQQIIAEEPANFVIQAEMCDLLIMENRLDEAKQLLSTLPPETEGIQKPKNRLEFITQAESLPSINELESQIANDPDNLQNYIDMAIRMIADDQVDLALEKLLEVLKKDREWQDQLSRKLMIKVFDMLGKGNAVATSYRRKMFAFLH